MLQTRDTEKLDPILLYPEINSHVYIIKNVVGEQIFGK